METESAWPNNWWTIPKTLGDICGKDDKIVSYQRTLSVDFLDIIPTYTLWNKLLIVWEFYYYHKYVF